MKQLLFFVGLIFITLSVQTASASSISKSTESSISTLGTSKHQSRLIEKFQKKIAKFNEGKALKDFDADSILGKDAKWWLKIFIVCLAVTIVVSFLDVKFLPFLFGSLTAVSFVIWLLKVLELM